MSFGEQGALRKTFLTLVASATSFCVVCWGRDWGGSWTRVRRMAAKLLSLLENDSVTSKYLHFHYCCLIENVLLL